MLGVQRRERGEKGEDIVAMGSSGEAFVLLSKECREIQDLCNEWMEARKAMFGEQRGWREGKTKKERQILEWACGQRGSRVCRGAEMSLDVSAAGQPLAPRPTIRWRFDVSGRTDPVIKQGSRRSQLLPIGRTRPCFSSISTELAKCSWKRTLERVICGPVPRNASAHLGCRYCGFSCFLSSNSSCSRVNTTAYRVSHPQATSDLHRTQGEHSGQEMQSGTTGRALLLDLLVWANLGPESR